MIYSLLDNDLYKFSMQQLVLHQFSNVEVEYDLAIRTKGVDLRPFREDIEREIRSLQSLMLSPEEETFMKSIRYLSPDYIEWLRGYRFNPDKHISIYEKDNNLAITVKGNWLQTILYEVPILAIVSECYHTGDGSMRLAECMERLNNKVELISSYGSEFQFAEFGTRRRNSYLIQDHVVGYLSKQVPHNMVGTSNVHFAMKYNLKPIGTMAHEIFQVAQSIFPLPSHQKDMLYAWAKEFKGDLGVALSDTLGSDYFLKDFTLDLAKLFDGTRQDSGDPYVYGHKIINHYYKLGVNSREKTVVFSDSLSVESAYELYKHFRYNIKVSFGIGTHLTNDCGSTPLSIVMKVQVANGIPVVKISDTPEKAIGRDVNYLEFMKEYAKNESKGI